MACTVLAATSASSLKVFCPRSSVIEKARIINNFFGIPSFPRRFSEYRYALVNYELFDPAINRFTVLHALQHYARVADRLQNLAQEF